MNPPIPPGTPIATIGCRIFGGATLQAWLPGHVYTSIYLTGPTFYDPTLLAIGITIVSALFWQEWTLQNPNDGTVQAGSILLLPDGWGLPHFP